MDRTHSGPQSQLGLTRNTKQDEMDGRFIGIPPILTKEKPFDFRLLYEKNKQKKKKFLMDHCATKSKWSLISTTTKNDKIQNCYESLRNKVVSEILLQQTENIRDSVLNHFVKQIKNQNFITNHFFKFIKFFFEKTARSKIRFQIVSRTKMNQ